QVAVRVKVRRLKRDVGTGKPAVRCACWIANGADETDGGLAEHVLFDPDGTENGTCGQAVHGARIGKHGAEVGVPDTTVHLSADVNRHLLAVEQSDGPAEERNDPFGQAEAKREDVGSFEEEGALLRKEQRKTRKVRLPRVDFGFREVRVDR